MRSVISIWTRAVRALLGMEKPTVKEIISGMPFSHRYFRRFSCSPCLLFDVALFSGTFALEGPVCKSVSKIKLWCVSLGWGGATVAFINFVVKVC